MTTRTLLAGAILCALAWVPAFIGAALLPR